MLRDGPPDGFVLGQQVPQQHQEIVIIKQLALALRSLIGTLELPQRLQMVRKVGKLVEDNLFQSSQRVLTLAVNLRNGSLARESLIFFVQAQLGAQEGDQIFGIAAIHNRKARFDPEDSPMAPQQHVGDRVKGTATDSLATRSDQSADSLQHLLRRLPSEGQQQNVRGIHPGIDQIGDAMHERPRFAASGTGNDQRRAIGRRHGRILLRVQLLGIIQRELPDVVLIRSPFQNVGLTLSVHVGIRLGSEAHDGSGRAV